MGRAEIDQLNVDLLDDSERKRQARLSAQHRLAITTQQSPLLRTAAVAVGLWRNVPTGLDMAAAQGGTALGLEVS